MQFNLMLSLSTMSSAFLLHSSHLTWCFLLFSSLITSVVSQKRCYLSNKNLDDEGAGALQPCNTSAEFSSCCGSDSESVCLFNSYCYSLSNLWIYWFSCINYTWQFSACSYFCSDDKLILNTIPDCHKYNMNMSADYWHSSVSMIMSTQLIPVNGNYFCCSEGNSRDNTLNLIICANPTHNSFSLFKVLNEYFIFNWTNGFTSSKSTIASNNSSATVTVSFVMVIVTLTAQHSSDKGHDITVELSVELPLSVLFLVTMFFLWCQIQQWKKLERQVQKQVTMSSVAGVANYNLFKQVRSTALIKTIPWLKSTPSHKNMCWLKSTTSIKK